MMEFHVHINGDESYQLQEYPVDKEKAVPAFWTLTIWNGYGSELILYSYDGFKEFLEKLSRLVEGGGGTIIVDRESRPECQSHRSIFVNSPAGG